MNKRILKKISLQGFTLIELLLGLGIFSIIAVTVYSVFWGGVRLSHRSEKTNETYREARHSLELMARELENMVPYNFSNSYPEKQAFAGDGKEITFFMGTDNGIRVVRYYLVYPETSDIHTVVIGNRYSKNVAVVTKEEYSSRVNYLVREEMDFIDYVGSDDSKDAEVEIISMNVKEGGLRFLYGHLDDPEERRVSWSSTWTYGYIPSNVRIEIDFLLAGQEQKTLTLTRDVLIPPGFWGVEES